LQEVRVEDVFGVVLDLRRAYVTPEALLQTSVDSLDPTGAAFDHQPFAELDSNKSRVRFGAVSEYYAREEGQLAEIVERRFANPRAALAALRRGEIDVVDRILPADAAELLSDKSPSEIVIAPYRLPTVHMLIPSEQNEFLMSRTFRRALVYGINREAILQKLLLQDRPLPGFRVISGPFAAPQFDDDLLAYAYDERVTPRAYDPHLSFLLARLARQELIALAEKRKEDAPRWRELVIGRPPGEMSRMITEAIARQLSAIKIDCRVEEVVTDGRDDWESQCDLLFVEAAMWEPIVDARRLLGARGVGYVSDAYVGLALRELDHAETWSDARQALQELHRIVHSEVSIVPLWQTVNYFAHRRHVTEMADSPVTLYQDVESWRIKLRTQ
jgi:ABC-type transport system substrate-binding protein